jgi:phosphate-selective porin OprO/OprP
MNGRAHRFRSALVACLALASISIAPAPAGADDTLEDLLVEKGIITEEERDGLGGDEEETPAPSPSSEDPDASSEEDPFENIAIDVSHKGLSIGTRDGAYKFAFGGRLQIDGAVFDEDESNLGNGVEMRRARIKSFGTVATDWDYKLEVNFDGDGRVPVTDGWIRYSGFKPFTVTVGHQKVPFSQQSMTSSNWQVFQERSLSDGQVDNAENGRRRMGIVLQSYGDHWNLAGGGFASGLDDAGTQDDDWGFASRLVFMPIAEKTRLLTVGGAFTHREFQGDSELRIRFRPGSSIAGTRLVDTGLLPTTRRSTLAGAESAIVLGPFHGQAEYVHSFIERGAGDPNLEFHAWYIQAGVFLTGESRNYDPKSAKFKRPTPKSKWGAWEVAARFDSIDLSDEDIRGGKQHDVTLGLNWWANRNIMFRLNYIYAHADPNSGVTLGDDDEQVHAFSARAQMVF